MPPGKGAGKTTVMVARARQGAARATILAGESEKEIKPVLADSVDEQAMLMSDSDNGLKAAGKDFAGRHTINHSATEYVRGNVHANTVEAVGGILSSSPAIIARTPVPWPNLRQLQALFPGAAPCHCRLAGSSMSGWGPLWSMRHHGRVSS